VSLINSIFDFLRFNQRNWKAIVLCLFAATVFWFFNALNKNYSANISFPVAFDYDQEKYIPVRSLPTSIRMNVSGLGWDLLRRSSGLKVPPLVIPLERPTDVQKIVGSTLPALFSTQLEGLQINFVLTDTVHIEMDQRIRRKIWLTLDSVNRYLDPDFGFVNTIRITPDTIWLEGPQRIVNALPDSLSLTLPRGGIDKNFEDEVEVVLNHNELIKRDPPVVQVSFQVERMIEVRDTLRLELINIPPRLKPSYDITEVQCTYRLPTSLSKTMLGDSLRAIVDFKNLSPGVHKIAPQITGLPLQSYLVKIDTVRINF
jgi:hypothetical protein